MGLGATVLFGFVNGEGVWTPVSSANPIPIGLPAGSGGGTADSVSVVWDGTAYPTQAATAPEGVVVRHFYGPVPYEGATWPGVLDTYDYAAL